MASSSSAVSSFLKPVPIPGSDGTLIFLSPAPHFFKVIIRLNMVLERCDDNSYPKIVIETGKTKQILVYIQNPNCSVENSFISVDQTLMKAFFERNKLDEKSDNFSQIIYRQALMDIFGEPFYYIKFCGLTDAQLEKEVELLFGCDLFQMPHIRHISSKDIVRLAFEFKNRMKVNSKEDPKVVRRELMKEYIPTMPVSAMLKLVAEMMDYVSCRSEDE